jgi:hypothetical protein
MSGVQVYFSVLGMRRHTASVGLELASVSNTVSVSLDLAYCVDEWDVTSHYLPTYVTPLHLLLCHRMPWLQKCRDICSRIWMNPPAEK